MFYRLRFPGIHRTGIVKPANQRQMEPTTGIEPVNLFLTKEVLYLLSYVGLRDCSQTRGLEKVHNVREYGTIWSQTTPRPESFRHPELDVCSTDDNDPLYGRHHLLHATCGGEGRIRTSEGYAGRFTVCSLWPLGNLTLEKPALRAMNSK